MIQVTKHSLRTSQVILRTINHAVLMMTQRSLADFRAGEEVVLKEGGDLATEKVTPVKQMRLLKFTADDESTQHKVFNFMFDSMNGLALRGYSDSETSHPCWNAFKKAVTRAGLAVRMMQLTLCCDLLEVAVALFCFVHVFT